MANRLTRVDEARLTIRRQVAAHGADLREARIAAGLRQIDVARALRRSASAIGRVERNAARRVAIEDLAAQAAAVGLKLSTQLYPAAGRLRDASQLQMINRYRETVAPGGWMIRLEVPVGGAGDLRAFDLVLSRPPTYVAHEFVSRLRDVQAQIRPLLRKQQDSGIKWGSCLSSRPHTRTGARWRRRVLRSARRSLSESQDHPCGVALRARARGERARIRLASGHAAPMCPATRRLYRPSRTHLYTACFGFTG